MARKLYTFSFLRMLTHIFLLAITAGMWLIIGLPYEVWRACRR